MTGWERLKNLWRISNIPAEDILLLPAKRQVPPIQGAEFLTVEAQGAIAEGNAVIIAPRKPATIVDLQDNVSTDFPDEEV